jgi:hypothetical protein
MRYLLYVCAFAQVLWQAANVRADSIFALPSEFSKTVNTETSTWSYRYRPDTSRNGNYLLLPTYGPSAGSWTPTNPSSWNTGVGGLPEIGVNQTSGTVANNTTTPADTFTLTSGTFWMRPGTGQIAVISWLFPFTEPMNLSIDEQDSGAALHGASGGTGGRMYYEKRFLDGTQDGGESFHGTSTTGHGSFTGPIGIIQPGRRINFILDPLANATFDSVSVTITITATPVPEPSGVALAVFGSLSAGIVVIRRFRGRPATFFQSVG